MSTSANPDKNNPTSAEIREAKTRQPVQQPGEIGLAGWLYEVTRRLGEIGGHHDQTTCTYARRYADSFLKTLGLDDSAIAKMKG